MSFFFLFQFFFTFLLCCCGRKAPGESEKTFLDRIQPTSSSLMVSSSFKHNASFVSRLPTIRRHKSTSFHSPLTKGAGLSRNSGEVRASSDNLGASTTVQTLNGSHSEDSVAETALSKKNSDDEDEEPRYIQLTNQHKGAIRAIRKLKYFVARRKFREALKPYDVKDVMEQYSSGHADLLNRTRNLQYRLDQILGKQGSKAKDVYASKISLASRVVKIERQVDDIETKLDQLIELYMEDRKRILTIPLNPEPQPQITNGDTAPQSTLPALPLNAQLLPKPILIEKMSSEPNSPTTKSFTEHRTTPKGVENHQIKKRVTLSSFPSGSESTSEEATREATKDVVIIVPTSSSTGGVQTIVAIDPDSENVINDSSEYYVQAENIKKGCRGEGDSVEGGGERTPEVQVTLYQPEVPKQRRDERKASSSPLLLARAAGTEIIITPTSRGNSVSEMSDGGSESVDLSFLCPDLDTEN